jgi:hypothetical protein
MHKVHKSSRLFEISERLGVDPDAASDEDCCRAYGPVEIWHAAFGRDNFHSSYPSDRNSICNLFNLRRDQYLGRLRDVLDLLKWLPTDYLLGVIDGLIHPSDKLSD